MLRGDEPIPGYHLLELLGRGGLGEVWRATAPGGAPVALKFIDLSTRQAVREMQAVYRIKDIRHAHLLPCTAIWLLNREGGLVEQPALALGEAPARTRQTLPELGELRPARKSPATLVVAMLLGDKSLYDRLEECRSVGLPGIPAAELLGYMLDAARGLDFLNSPRHDLGSGLVALQHCDVKPQNMVLAGDSVMVCDFGLATVLGGNKSRTRPMGSPAYVAPECAAGKPPTRATDQYSLAITYYELRTGRLPFDDESTLAVLNAHVAGTLRFDEVDLPERGALRRATALDADRRYESSVAMVEALRAALRGGATAPGATAPGATAAGATGGWRRSGAETEQRRSATVSSPLPLSPPAASPRPSPAEPSLAGLPTAPLLSPVASPAASSRVAKALIPVELAPGPSAMPAPAVSRPSKPAARSAAPEEQATLPNVPPKARESYLRGMAHLKRSELPQAIASFTDAIDAYREFGEAYNRRALALRKAGKFSEALADCHRALQYNPSSATTYRNRGQVYFRRRRYKQALADFTAAILMNSQDGRSYLKRGRVYEALGDPRRAIEDYSTALELRPGDFAGHVCRGAAYESLGDDDQALFDYTRALAARPADVLTRAFRASLYLRQGRDDEALADYARCVQERPEPEFYRRLGEIHARHGRHAAAVENFTAALLIHPDAPRVYSLRGLSYKELGQAELAAADFEAARRLGGGPAKSARGA